MLNGIGDLAKILRAFPQIGQNKSSSSSATNYSSSTTEDKVELSPATLDSVRVQAGVLRNQLPGLIANSLLEPVSSNQGSDPLNALLTQVVNPAQNLLNSSSASFSADQLKQFQTEVETFRDSLPRLLSNELIAPLTQNASQSSALNGVLNGFSDQLSNLAELIKLKVS